MKLLNKCFPLKLATVFPWHPDVPKLVLPEQYPCVSVVTTDLLLFPRLFKLVSLLQNTLSCSFILNAVAWFCSLKIMVLFMYKFLKKPMEVKHLFILLKSASFRLLRASLAWGYTTLSSINAQRKNHFRMEGH